MATTPMNGGLTDFQKYQLGAFQGYGGTFDEWKNMMAADAAKAQQNRLAAPNVVVGGTPVMGGPVPQRALVTALRRPSSSMLGGGFDSDMPSSNKPRPTQPGISPVASAPEQTIFNAPTKRPSLF